MRVRQILFGTDFSPASEAARRVAVDMAREAGATLHVVHVVPSVTDPSLPAEQLTELAKAVDGGLRVTTALLDGSAGGEIVRYAQEQQIDLIVVGTHGRTGFSRALLGSVAESVVRLAPCLVLSVPAALFEKAAVPADVEAVPSTSRPCLVCGRTSAVLVCETCRTRIRAEALHRKQAAERPGHRGLPV
jgi:nucleotide-binding universal stress UspA family protein